MNEVNVMQDFRPKSHNHIVEILGHGSLGELAGEYYIDMEYCEINLDQYLYGKAPPVINLLEYKTAIEEGYLELFIFAIMQELLKGLEFIHSHRKVHRDLKPQNSMFSLKVN